MSNFEYDVFLSHNSRDKERVRRLAERLRENGLKVWFDEWLIRPGDDIYLAIEKGLDHSRALVLCISSAAFGSGWVSLERTTVLFRDPSNQERRFIPLLLTDCSMPDTLKRFMLVDYRDETDQAFRKLLNACAEGKPETRRTRSSVVKHVKVQPDVQTTNVKEESLRENHARPSKAKRPQITGVAKHIEHRTFFATKDDTQVEAKRLIGEHVAATFLQDGDPILLDAGTSLCAVARAIAKKTSTEPSKCHFTILTHNLSAFEVLVRESRREAHLNVVLAGGRFDADLNALFGNQTIFAIQDFFPRVVVIGISGLIANLGVFCHGNTEELDVKRAIFSKHARDRIIVADYTKLGTGDALLFGGAQAFGAGVERCILVTNAPPKGTSRIVHDKFNSEIKNLTEIQGISVEIVA